MESLVIIVNGFQPLTIITKRYILDVAAVLDPSLLVYSFHKFVFETDLPSPKIKNSIKLISNRKMNDRSNILHNVNRTTREQHVKLSI